MLNVWFDDAGGTMNGVEKRIEELRLLVKEIFKK